MGGLDGKAKMSKSLNNAIYLADSREEIWDKVREAVTDPARIRKMILAILKSVPYSPIIRCSTGMK